MGEERLLHRMQAIPARHAFDREDVGAVVADRERQARIEPASIDEDGAGAALPAVAALLGAGQMKPLAKQVEQRDPGVIERDRPLHAVHGETRRDAHAVLRR